MAASVERSSGGGEQNSLTLGSTSVPAVSPVKSLHDVVFEPRAYTKMILHAAKYPHCATNGLLLAQAQKDSRKCLTLTDCIPLFHQSEGLTPMLEVALGQIEARCERAGLVVAGYYHANRSLKDNSVDVFSQKIADKVAENTLSSSHKKGTGGGSAVLVTIDNKRLSLVLESPAVLVQMVSGSDSSEGACKWRSLAARSIGVDEETLDLTSTMVQRKIYKDLVDFDNHLDDVTQDYLNVEINIEISDQH